MHRIDTPNRALALYGAGKDGWRDGVMASGILPTEFNAAFLNAIQEEISGVVEGAGLALNPAANNQLLLAIEDLIEVRAGNYVLDTGVANAYVVALNPVPPARVNGQVVRFRVAHANTGAATINDGFGVVGLLNDVGGALVGGDLPLGGVATAVFDLTVGAYLMVTLVPSQAITQTQADARYAAFLSGMPTGGILIHSGTSAPPGFLVCPAALTNISRTTYAALFAVIGTLWGPGDGATTFGLPTLSADYAILQANGNVGTGSAGSVIAHAHSGGMDGMQNLIGGSSGAFVHLNTQPLPNTGTTGGSANFAAGVRFLICVKY